MVRAIIAASLCLGLLVALAEDAGAAPKRSVFGVCVDKGLAPCTVQSAKCSERCHGEGTCLTACKRSFTSCRNEVVDACQKQGQTGPVNPPRTHAAPR